MAIRDSTDVGSTGLGLRDEPKREHFSATYRWYVVGLLASGFTMYAADRILLGVLVEPIKREFGASDSRMGLVGLLAASSYALFVIPFGLLADRANRRKMLSVILTGWSLMTALSAFTRSAVQLAAAQVLAAMNESGGASTMSSLIADLFKREHRGLPMGIWYCGISMGSLVGYTGGGLLADAYGWRTTFLILGAPGLLIALLVWATVRDTPRGMADGSDGRAPPAPNLRGTFKYLASQTGLRHAIFAQCLSGIAFMGPIYWLVSFFVRTHGASVSQAGSVVGVVFLVAGLLSGPLGGLFMDRLGRRDVRWHGWICVILMLVGGFAMAGIYLAPTMLAAFVACFLWQLLTNAVSPITVTIVSNFAPAQYRGLSVSLGFLLFQLMGFGVGAQLIGNISDWLSISRGLGERDALRIACLTMVVFHAWAAFHFWVVARHAKEGYRIAADLERSAAPSVA
jgi:predicted MFS family arabinose efflux permease